MDYKRLCQNCPPEKHCCIFMNNPGFTFVSQSDAKSIKKKTKKEYSYFLDFSPLPKKTVYLLKKDDPSLEGFLRYTMLDKEGRLLRLKTKKDGRCIFLDDNKECEIYDIRPNVCRIYPFWAIRLIDGNLKIIRHDPEPRCPIIDDIGSNDPDEVLSEEELQSIKEIFAEIEKEAGDY
ncbi:MAG: YkgJ family cysteine cluster protein [Nanoarchaeota archaeon]|nr:YkgJ family cysteine cluster protein [Nanoarchaeota archaeon]